MFTQLKRRVINKIKTYITMQRYDIINGLIKKYNYQSYLEIGTQNRANCFDKVECKYKSCVDPDPNAKADYIETSDSFFATAADPKISFQKPKFDIIFIDGLHHADQVEKDIENSLLYLSDNGTIVVHDCNPKEELHQIVPRVSKIWNGDVWKAWVKIRSTHRGMGLQMFVVDTDYGCGIIRNATDTIFPLIKINEEITWNNFSLKRKLWLNLISIKEFQAYLENQKH